MRTPFRAYDLAVTFYRNTRSLGIKGHLRDQLERASSSIALNLNEGSAKSSRKDRLRFYEIALGSIRECQGVFALLGVTDGPVFDQLDHVAAITYKLCAALRNSRR